MLRLSLAMKFLMKSRRNIVAELLFSSYTITDPLQETNFHPNGNFYVAFWPSPAQSGGSSLWDTVGEDNLVNMVDAYKFY